MTKATTQLQSTMTFQKENPCREKWVDQATRLFRSATRRPKPRADRRASPRLMRKDTASHSVRRVAGRHRPVAHATSSALFTRALNAALYRRFMEGASD